MELHADFNKGEPLQPDLWEVSIVDGNGCDDLLSW